MHAYIKVSDDEGHLLGDKTLETEVKALYAELDDGPELGQDPDTWTKD